MTNSEARTRWFQLLALGFTHPQQDIHRLMIGGDYELTLAQAGAHALGMDVALPGIDSEFADFEAGFIHLFQVGKRGMPQVSLNAADYEGLVDGENRPEFLLQHSSWYRHFGLKVADGEGANELPDHLVCQLEFLTWLSHLESVNVDDTQSVAAYQRAQRDFLQRHLSPFLEALVTALQGVDQFGVVSFYRALAVHALESIESLLAMFDASLIEAVVEAADPEMIDTVNLWG